MDIGPAGCNQIGPTWDLETVYDNLSDEDPSDGDKLDDSLWRITANHNQNDVQQMIYGQASTRWTTRALQSPGQYITIDLGRTENFNTIVLDSVGSSNDYPRGYSVSVSSNATNFNSVVASGAGQGAVVTIHFPRQSARYVRITQTGSHTNYWWSIHELEMFDEQSTDQGDPEDPPMQPQQSSTSIIGALMLLLFGDELE